MISETKQAVEKKNIVLENKLHNRFDVEVRDAVTGEMKQKAQAFNVILDQFWTRLFANQNVYGYIQYGSGSGTPAASDTALFNWVGGAGASAAVYDDAHYADGWNSFTKSIVIDEQTAVGVTLTEVGLAGATNSALVTHAMLQDMNGNPISILKTNTDIIVIYATVYIHWNVNGTNGVKYIPTGHWFGENSGTYKRLEGGKGLGINNYTFNSSYKSLVADAVNKSWTWGPWRIPANSGNIKGIRHIGFSNFIDVDLSEVYQITNEAVGTGDGTTTEFSVAFDAPYDITVYVDGVICSVGLSTGQQLKFEELSIPFLYYFDKIYEDDTAILAGTTAYLYNPYYVTNPVKKVQSYGNYSYASIIYASNDLVNWGFISASTQRWVDVPVEYQSCKYWKVVRPDDVAYLWYNFATTTPKAIVFDTPPAAGAVITADYKTPFVPKDENHVYDFNLTIQLGEYNNP